MTKYIQHYDPEVYEALKWEEKRLKEWINLIPSENYTYPEVLEMLGTVFNDKYSEWYPGRRYYGWNEFTDKVETLAIERAKKIFRAEHANVQPLSGSPMNQAVYLALLEPGDTVLAMDLSHGWHLTHGAPVSHMGKIFNFIRYKTNPENGWKIDFEELMELAKKVKPKLVLCGYTSYPRDYDYRDFKKIADEVWALTMADVSHIWGLIAAGVMANPLDYWFDVITTTTHKTLRWPRWGMILCKKEHASKINKSVFPGLQWWPHMHTIASLAAALNRALKPEFKIRGQQVLDNSKSLAAKLMELGAKLITDWTDNHMIVLNTVESFGIDGTIAEETLEKVWISVNKQIIPDDPNPPLRPSGIRLGTPAITSRWLKEKQAELIWEIIYEALNNYQDEEKLANLKEKIKKLWAEFPLDYDKLN